MLGKGQNMPFGPDRYPKFKVLGFDFVFNECSAICIKRLKEVLQKQRPTAFMVVGSTIWIRFSEFNIDQNR